MTIETCPRCFTELAPYTASPGMFCCPCGDWNHPPVCLECLRLIFSHLEAHPVVRDDIPDIGGFDLFPKWRLVRERLSAAWGALNGDDDGR